MAKIYKKGEKYYYESGNTLYSCEIEGSVFWPDSSSNPNYEEHVIESTYESPKKVSYNKPQVINFQPLGTFVYADFGITQDILNYWEEVFDNQEPYENLHVTVLGYPVTYAWFDGSYGIMFENTYGQRAFVSLETDRVRISPGDTGDK